MARRNSNLTIVRSTAAQDGDHKKPEFVVNSTKFCVLFVVLALCIGGERNAFGRSVEVQLSVVENYGPYSDENLPGGGMLTEIVRTIFQSMDLQVSNRYMPRKRAYQSAQQDLLDGSFPWEAHQVQLDRFYMSDPIIVLDTEIYMDRRSTLKVENLDDLKGLTLCLPIGHVPFGPLKSLVQSNEVRLVTARKMNSCFSMLKAGRVNMVSTSRMVANVHSKSVYGFIDAVKTLPFGSSSTTMHLVLSKNQPDTQELTSRFNARLTEIRNQGVLEEIVKRHIWVR